MEKSHFFVRSILYSDKRLMLDLIFKQTPHDIAYEVKGRFSKPQIFTMQRG